MLQQQKSVQLFQSFGLTTKESILFLELIKLGSSSVSTWARLTGTKRSSMYVTIKKFKKLHLIKEFQFHGMKYVTPIELSAIEELINKKAKEISETKNLYNEIKSDLIKTISFPAIMPKIKFYEGVDEVESVYDAILKESEFISVFNPERVKAYMPKYHFLIPQNLKKNRGKAREILVSSNDAIEYKEKFNSLRHQIKILPTTINFSSDTIISGDKIYMIAYGDNNETIIATEIWNRELADTQRTIFNMMWNKY